MIVRESACVCVCVCEHVSGTPPPRPLQSPPPPHTRETVTWPKKLRKHEAPKKFSLGHTRIRGGRPSLGDRLPSPPPPPRRPSRARGGRLQGGGGTCACVGLHSWIYFFAVSEARSRK